MVWIFLLSGLVLTGVTALLTAQLVTRRRAAEADAARIAGLYATLDDLYGDQRSIAETLQQALLPQRNPVIARFATATRYVPGGQGVEIGGDWFSVIEIDADTFAFSLGDVSGKGVSAAAIMAELRFTIRAYLAENAPDEVLHMCSRQLDVSHDGHFCTVLVGVGDIRTGTITIANAGRLEPLLISEGSVSSVRTSVGLPLGVQESEYRPTLPGSSRAPPSWRSPTGSWSNYAGRASMTGLSGSDGRPLGYPTELESIGCSTI